MPVNVASVPQRSPFRYPGGKTWLVPTVRTWLAHCGGSDATLIDAFAGGGIVGLTAAMEGLVQRVVMVELDEDVAAVWNTIINGDAEALARRILGFELSKEHVRELLESQCTGEADRAFRTIVRNRVNRGGILADGASMIKSGENGKGLASRWYPNTLAERIRAIALVRSRIHFERGDALTICKRFQDDARALFFFDPPYVVAGGRLYRHSTIDHLALFELAYATSGQFLMTYDDYPEIQSLAAQYNFKVGRVPMKTTHHIEKEELLISRNLDWLAESEAKEQFGDSLYP